MIQTHDFIYRVLDFVKSLDTDIPVRIGTLDTEDTIAIVATGGQTIQEYYDGVKDKRLDFEVGIKTLNDQQLAISTLDFIASELEDAHLPSHNESYEFIRINIIKESFLRGQDTKGFFFYRFAFSADLTILKNYEVN